VRELHRGDRGLAPSLRWQAFGLVALAPFLAELVSGSTPPQEWILPPVFLVFMAIYGLSALVIRDLAIRFRGGPATILVLGLAFGIVNEGMAAHSLFNPAWPGVDVLASYGRWEGVSWLWVAWILPFHAVWSISIPIFLVGQIWPENRDRRLLTDRTLLYLIPIPIVVAVAGSFLIAGYTLTAGQWIGMFVAVLALGWIALRWGRSLSRLRPLGRWFPSPRLAFCAGAMFFVLGQIGTWQTPRLGPYPEVGLVLLVGAFLLLAAMALGLERTPAGDRSRFAFVLGGIAFYVGLSPLSEFALGRFGLVFIDVAVFYLLFRLYEDRTRAAARTTVPPHVAWEAPDPP
jgi:hypothetical protein